jgi:sugar/nucleoside kinase (ribokinase family)
MTPTRLSVRGPRILFAGDVNVDIVMPGLPGPVELDREILSTGFDTVLGSSAAITACAHARLGGPTAFAGLGGDDAHGALMRTWLEEAGADCRHLVLSKDQRTGVTVNILTPAGRYQVTYAGAIPRFVPDTAAIIADQRIGHVHFSGIYLQTDLLPRLPTILAELSAAGIGTSIDPQWDGSGRWWGLDEWVPRLSLLFVNEDEAMNLSRTQDAEAALDALSRRCPQVVVKRGAAGVLARTPQGTFRQAGLRISGFRDAIGAGDNLAAAWLYATRTAGMAEAGALAFANAAAARSCTFSGGSAARSTHHDVASFLESHR